MAWPWPVSASEPNSSTLIARGAVPALASSSVKARAIRIGPTVCELDGPIPIVNRSATLIATLLSIRDRARGRLSSVMARQFTTGSRIALAASPPVKMLWVALR